jgi:hypothetical protein
MKLIALVRRTENFGVNVLNSEFQLIEGFRCSACLIENETFLVPEVGLKMMWERFLTAIQSAEQTFIIVVKNHSHQPLTSC